MYFIYNLITFFYRQARNIDKKLWFKRIDFRVRFIPKISKYQQIYIPLLLLILFCHKAVFHFMNKANRLFCKIFSNIFVDMSDTGWCIETCGFIFCRMDLFDQKEFLIFSSAWAIWIVDIKAMTSRMRDVFMSTDLE